MTVNSSSVGGMYNPGGLSGNGLSTGGAIAANVLGGAVGIGLYTKDLGTGLIQLGINSVFMAAFGPLGLIAAGALLPKCDKYRAFVTRTCQDGNMEIAKIEIQTQKMKRYRCRWKDAQKIETITDNDLITRVKSKRPVVLPVIPVASLARLEADALAEINSMTSLQDLIESADGEEFDNSPNPMATTEEKQAFQRILNAMESKEVAIVDAYINHIKSLINGIPVVRSPATAADATLLDGLNSTALKLKEQKDLGQAYIASLGDLSKLNSGQRSRVNSISAEIGNIDNSLSQIDYAIANIRSAIGG